MIIKQPSSCPKRGAALVSVLAMTAIVLLIITSTVMVSIINARISFDQTQTQKVYQSAKGLVEEVILRFIRERSFTNPYPEWTADCLQIQDFECKMDLNLTAEGGIVDVWGKSGNKIRHFQFELDVLEDESVSLSGVREIN